MTNVKNVCCKLALSLLVSWLALSPPFNYALEVLLLARLLDTNVMQDINISQDINENKYQNTYFYL